LKKWIAVSSALLWCLATALAQDISYYQQQAQLAKRPAERLTALDSVTSKARGLNDSILIDYSIQYIELAKELDSISLAAKKTISRDFSNLLRQQDPIKLIRIIDGVLAHKYKLDNSYLVGNLYIKRGRAQANLDLKSAIEDYNLAIENFSEKDSLYVADAYLFSGQAYSKMGKFVSAGENLEKAYQYFEALKDYEYMLHAKQGITTMFSQNGFYEKAKDEREALIQKLIDLDLQEYLPIAYYNQALDYSHTGNKELEFDYLMKARMALEDAGPEAKNYAMRINVHAQLANFYIEENQLEKAREHIVLIDGWVANVSENKLARSAYAGAKAKYHHAIREEEKALLFAQEKLESAQLIGYEDDILNSHLLLSEIYYNTGNYRASLDHNNAYLRIKDSIYTRSNANSLAYYQTLYETQKKEKELFEKNTNIQLLEKDNETFKKMVFFGGLAIMLAFGLIILYRNQRHLRTNKVLQEKFSQKLLVSQEEERKRISKDLHDGLGQHLLLIKNKLMSTGDEETKKMVDQTIDEVRTISRDLHPFQLQEMGITKAIEHTLTQIDENTTLFISSDIENIDNLFPPEKEVNIYRIVQESLNNVLKHANAEASKVSVKRLTNTILISIQDNGIGFDFSEKYQDAKSLGLKTILERTKFLNGQMKVQSKKNNGTTLVFQFPIG
jgi:signal transduction histidine kinase